MIAAIVKKIFGSRNDRLVRRYTRQVKSINAKEAALQALTDEALRDRAGAVRGQLAALSADEQLVEVFALVREVSRRVMGMRHFDVQLIGGMALHEGKVAEMRTGEGKTLAATLPACLNALLGSSVHVVTVNHYLAGRDAHWMTPIYDYFGLTVAVNVANMSVEQKQAAYQADIIYGTNNEFGFDYLRDNMVYEASARVQTTRSFCIIDEVDSILIDEARTPLIISGAAEDASDWYAKMRELVVDLKPQARPDPVTDTDEPITDDERGSYVLDEKHRQVQLTELGQEQVEAWLKQRGLLSESASLFDAEHLVLMHYVLATLRAHTLFKRDVDYVVKQGEVIIIDEHTGRLMPGRRWSDGLHQAVETKEGVSVQLENQTLASITFQNYFRLYDKLSGMTGTADTEAFELNTIYNLEVVVIPTNQPMVRKDREDMVFLTAQEKDRAIIEDIKGCLARAQPVLVGTASVERSEHFSRILSAAGIAHQVLNAKNHEEEAGIIANAGRPSSVTIATNMAGRGTDIVLGGCLHNQLAQLGESASEADKQAVQVQWQCDHDQVIQAGGLHVLGTERHESRRIDNQLRGRSGRQGDPGSSQFFLSFEDNLLRIFAAERMSQLMRRLGLKEGEVIQHRWINRSIENAQRRVEGVNFDARKQLLEYDDVANEQRRIIYGKRDMVLQAESLTEIVQGIQEDALAGWVSSHMPADVSEDQWTLAELQAQLDQLVGMECHVAIWLEEDSSRHAEDLLRYCQTKAWQAYQQQLATADESSRQAFERGTILQVLDYCWKEHLATMDYLRQNIHFRGYAQKNPVQEYKQECFALFQQLMIRIKEEVTIALMRVQVEPPRSESSKQVVGVNYHHSSSDDIARQPQQETPKLGKLKQGRNTICHCGSGKKFKRCCGQLG